VISILAQREAIATNSSKALVGDKLLLLPVPVGFVDPREANQILHSNAERLTPPHMRLLAVYVNDTDISATKSGTAPKFESYFMVQVLRSKEANSVDVKEFSTIKAQVQGAPKVEDQKQVHAEVQRHVDSAARDVGSKAGYPNLTLRIGESRQLEIFNETETSLSMLVVSGVKATNGSESYAAVMGQATSFVLIRGKVVLFTAYKKIEGDGDYSWLRKQSESWTKLAADENPS
jgi:hypothetical protein